MDRSVSAADRHYNGTARAREVLLTAGAEVLVEGVAKSIGGVASTLGGVARANLSDFDAIRKEVFEDKENFMYSYFMKAC